MRADGSHQHDLVLRKKRADPMHHQCIENVPSAACLEHDGRQCAFGHAGIVFQRHGRHATFDTAVFIDVAYRADKTGDRADLRPARALGGTQRRHFARQVEVFGLDAHRHEVQPPVTGGKKAISSASPMAASAAAMS